MVLPSHMLDIWCFLLGGIDRFVMVIQSQSGEAAERAGGFVVKSTPHEVDPMVANLQARRVWLV
jgi:hypothetical protein